MGAGSASWHDRERSSPRSDAMLSHVCVGVSDTARAYDFYAPLFAALGLRLKFREPDGWSGSRNF
ncbi:VOC family protein, partial [Burkholderia cenocepacia]|uniref:VOC family protein n=1 Tax=Burkholderia cenocepacia TaxID=95486 RepID=UPI003BFA762C